MPVHDVDVQQVGSGQLQTGEIGLQISKVGGDYRRGDADPVHEAGSWAAAARSSIQTLMPSRGRTRWTG
jgi:hypothetical protein